MKRQILALATALALGPTAYAAVLVSDSFNYADGVLTAVSSGAWTNHSGSGSVTVVNQAAILETSRGEDVSTGIPATSTGNLYASFKINFSVLPSTSSYFVHFRDLGTGFRARVFVTTSGATPGSYRVGIANGGSTFVSVAKDLSLGTEYKLVVRWNLDTRVATLWINPNSESSVIDKADGTDAATAITLNNFCFRQNAGMGTVAIDDVVVGTAFADVATVGGPPTISTIPNQSIAAGGSTGPVPFVVNDVETPAAALTLAAYSDNTVLIPNQNVIFGGSGENRTVNISGAAGQQGTANVAVVVTDGSSSTATSMVSVVVGRPTISTVPSQITKQGTPFPVINFTVNDTETPNSLTVVGYSSNQGLITDAGLQVSGTGTSRTLQITAVAGQTGVATIDLVVSDSLQSATNRFLAAVSPTFGVLVSDDFSYNDGTLQEASGYYWLGYSSSLSNDLVVASQKVLLTYSNYMDCHAYFSNSVTLGGSSGAMLYSKLIVNQKETPRGSGGNYFAYFKESGSSQFRARIFTQTNGAAPGKFRLAISNGGFTQQAFPQDLDTNVDYTVITKYDTVNNLATLWVNPASESSPSVSGVDFTTSTDLMTYALRQDSSLGVLTVDNLRVGTAWSDVYSASQPFPIALNIQKNSNGTVTLTWGNPSFRLQWSANPASGWADVAGAVSGYTEAATGTKYFRLINP